MGSDPSADLAQDELLRVDDGLMGRYLIKILTIPSSPAASDQWASQKFRNKWHPFPIKNGPRVLPNDAQAAIRFIAGRGSLRTVEFRRYRLAKLECNAERFTLRPNEIRDGLAIERVETRARLHTPFLRELLRAHGMGGAEWRDQSVRGFPMLRDVA